MDVGRKRTVTPDDLPKRVYPRRGRYYYVDYQGKWHGLGRTKAEMYRNLADLIDPSRLPTMAALITDYERAILPTLAPATQVLRYRHIATIRQVFAAMDADQITAPDIARVRRALAAKSVVQANRWKSTLSAIFSHGIELGYVRTNPCREVKRLTERPRDRYVEDWEIAVMAKAAMERYPYLPLVMDAMNITAQPKADVIGLTRAQIRDNGIEFRRSKTGKRLLVQWSPALRQVIDCALALHGRVAHTRIFVNARGWPLSTSGFETAWGKMQRQLLVDGVLKERFRPHDLRAKAGSDSDNHLLLGHADPRLFARVYKRNAQVVQPAK